MGVLEARKDAETVGYPVVGEEKKDASNVIDYDIHDEVTINTSSVFNANNDTTTGMANVIPGVNAPKLIASTSIIGLEGGDLSYAVGLCEVSDNYTETEMQPNLGGFTVSDSGGDGLTVSGNRITFQKDGVFYFDIRQVITRTTVASGYFVRTIIYKNGTQIMTGRVAYGPTGFVWTGPLQVSKGDYITIGGCIWSEGLGYAPSGTGPSWDISITEMR